MGPSPHEDGSEKVKPAVRVLGITRPHIRIVTKLSKYSSDFGKKFFTAAPDRYCHIPRPLSMLGTMSEFCWFARLRRSVAAGTMLLRSRANQHNFGCHPLAGIYASFAD